MKSHPVSASLVSLFVVLGLLVAFSSSAFGSEKKKKDEHEKEVDIAKIPAPARQAILKEVGDGKITKVLEGSDTEGGKPTYYEAKYRQGEKKLEVKVAPDGKFISKGDDDD
jgi:hypothetical protein